MERCCPSRTFGKAFLSDSRRDIQSLKSGHLEPGDGQRVYWETWGNPEGTPIIFVHGGPGGGCTPGHREFFDPERFHVVFFDQRGCGRSTPLASDPNADLSSNTTQDLIADMERIRQDLNIEAWIVFGLSWGTTLGLAYAQTHPDRVNGVVLGAIGLTSPREVHWITEGVARVFAPEWEEFSSFVPEGMSDLPLVEAYHRLLMDPNPDVHMPAARQWCRWEDAHMGLLAGSGPGLQDADDVFQLGFARLVTHYWSNGAFLGDTELLDNIGRLSGIPAVLVQGRYDVSSPIETPWLLNEAWDSSELVVIEDAGHGGGSMSEAIIDGLNRITSTLH